MLDVKLVRKRQTNYPQVFKAINRNFLQKAGVEISKEVKRRMRAVGLVDTGRLINSVQFRVSGDQVSIGTNVEYAVYPEYGTGIYAEGGGGRKTPWTYFVEGKGYFTTRGMVARPTWRPALDNNRKFLVKLWAETYNKVFKVLGGKA